MKPWFAALERPTAAVPSAATRLRHGRTDFGVDAHRRAISPFETPSPAHNNALAWRTSRVGAVFGLADRSPTPSRGCGRDLRRIVPDARGAKPRRYGAQEGMSSLRVRTTSSPACESALGRLQVLEQIGTPED